MSWTDINVLLLLNIIGHSHPHIFLYSSKCESIILNTNDWSLDPINFSNHPWGTYSIEEKKKYIKRKEKRVVYDNSILFCSFLFWFFFLSRYAFHSFLLRNWLESEVVCWYRFDNCVRWGFHNTVEKKKWKWRHKWTRWARWIFWP